MSKNLQAKNKTKIKNPKTTLKEISRSHRHQHIKIKMSTNRVKNDTVT